MSDPILRAQHDAGLKLRVNRSLLGRVEAAAFREGVSVSEFTRTALRREIASVGA
jgi:hypothetical protein